MTMQHLTPNTPTMLPAPIWHVQPEQQHHAGEVTTPPVAPTTAEVPTTGPTVTTPVVAPVVTTPVVPVTPAKVYTAEETAAYTARLRDEAKSYREAKEAADLRATTAEGTASKVLAAFGLAPDGTKLTDVDPAKLQADLDTRQKAQDATARENLLLRVSSSQEHRANADALLDSLQFRTKLDALASTDRAGVETLVDEYVKNDAARYSVTPPSASSSGGTSHTGTPVDPTARKSKSAAIADAYPRTP